MKRVLAACALLLAGCGDPFVLVCDALGYHVIEEAPAVYPSSSAVVPVSRPTRPNHQAGGRR